MRFETCLALFGLMGCGEILSISRQEQDVALRSGILEVDPPQVVFGEVLPNTTPSVTLTLENTGNGVLDLLDLQVEGSEAFLVESVVFFPTEFLPGDTGTIEVRFRPTGGQLDQAEIIIISNADNGDELRVPINGIGASADLVVEPGAIAFGELPIACSRTQPVTLRNEGSAPVTVTGLGLLELRPGLSVFDAPILPLLLQPSAEAKVTVGFAPEGTRDVSTSLIVQSDDPKGEVALPVSAKGVALEVVEDRFEVPPAVEHDIVLVVDRSCSMADQGQAVGQAAASLIGALDGGGASWRAGVLLGERPACFRRGGWFDASTTSWSTELVEAAKEDPGGDPWVTTADDLDVLTEAQLETLRLASYQDLDDGCLGGFHREGAWLHLIVVSDERDQSPGYRDAPGTYWQDYLDDFQAWSGDPALLRMHAIVDTQGVCGEAPVGPGGYLQVAQETGGVVANICRTVSTAFDDLIGELRPPPTVFPLSRSPAWVDSVEVFVDGEAKLTGWTFDPVPNQVTFDRFAPPGSTVLLRYRLLLDCPA